MIGGWKRGIKVKDKTQIIGWIILFLIASGFIGFGGAWILDGKTPLSYPICVVSLTICSFLCSLVIFRLIMKRAQKQALWAMFKRGCFHEVDRQIDENSKEMKYLWELKMLACFHSGNRSGFEHLYNSYMNEINECKTLGSYMLRVLHELIDAMSHDKPPAVFLKNDTKKRSYIKQRDYQLYYQIETGIQEYYGSQKQLMKIYFEKFLIQTDVLSKPLGFYLYYLMTAVMVESDHPQWEDYYRKTQQYVFDQDSLGYMEKLKTKIYGIQKGTGTLQLMNRDMNRTRRNNPLYEENQQSLNRSFNYQQPAFRRERTQKNSDPRHSANVQKEFDEMNSELNENNTFSLYEDDEMDLLNQKRKGAVNESTQTMAQEDLDDDLDPTWFARKGMEPTAQTQSFAQPTPSISEPARNYQKQQPINQTAETQGFAYQDDRAAFMQDFRNHQNTPAFVDQRSQQAMNLERTHQQRNIANEQQGLYPNQVQAPQLNQQPAYMQQMNQRRNQMDEELVQEPYQAYPSENSQQLSPKQAMRTPSIPEEEIISKKQLRKAKGKKQKRKQDPFDFQEEVQEAQPAKRVQKQPSTLRPYSTYVHQNVIVFFISLLDAVLVSVATASIVYTNFFKRYTSVNAEIVTDIIIKSLIISVLAAYLTASVHTGYMILKKSLQNWKTPVKVLLSPLLLVISLLIGIIAEIPYFIYASIKKGREKA